MAQTSIASHDSSSTPKEIYNVRLCIVTLVASVGAIMLGYDLAFIGTSISLESFRRDFGLEHVSESKNNNFAANVVSLMQAGCFAGSLAAAPLSEKYGRKVGLVISSLLYIAGSAMQTWANCSHRLLFAGRVVGGLGVGLAGTLIPLHVAECSPPEVRGRLVGCYEIGVQLGTLIGFWINYGVNKNLESKTSQWMIPFAVQLIPGGLFFLGMFLTPESPRWIVRHKGEQAALHVLARLRGLRPDHQYLQDEISGMAAHLGDKDVVSTTSGILSEIKELFGVRTNRNRIILGILICTFKQFTGSNAINYYSPKVFKSIGLEGETVMFISTGIYGTVRFIAVCIAMIFLIDRCGRVNLLLIGSLGMSVCMYYLGSFITMNHVPGGHQGITTASGVAAAALYIFTVFFSISWAGGTCIYVSEIFQLRVRSLAMSICAATHWILNFVIARSTPYMLSNIRGGTYFLFAGCLTLSIPFVWFYLPETKGIRLEDMEDVFVGMTRSQLGKAVGGTPKRTSTVENTEVGVVTSKESTPTGTTPSSPV